MEAERETDDLKKAEYMVPFVGEAFDAHITGITSFGLFVGLENGIEGLIHISLLTDDDYEFDEASYTMRGRLGGHVYRLGDSIEVTLAKVNTDRCEIDFVPGRVDSLEDLQQRMAASMEKRHHRSKETTKRDWMNDAGHKPGKKDKKGKKNKKNSRVKKSGRKTKKKKARKGRKTGRK